MKNIWIFNQYNMPPEYGHLNRHYNLAKYLNKKGYIPTVIVGSYLHNSNVQMIRGGDKYIKYMSCEFPYYFVKTLNYSDSKIKRVIAMFQYCINSLKLTKKLGRPDVIIGSSAHPLSGVLAILLSRKYKCQSIVEVRDLWPETFVAYGLMSKNNILYQLAYHLEKLMYKYADKLIFTMEGGSDYIIEQGWNIEAGGCIDMRKVTHINNGVDLSIFYDNIERNKIEDFDLNSDKFKVVYAGSIRLINNVKKIIQTAEILMKTHADEIQFLIYGDGNDKDELEKYCIDNQISNIIFKGMVNKNEIPYILSKCDLNILHFKQTDLKRYGASLNKLFEYFASGKPTISDCMFNYDLIERYQCGVSIDNADTERLSKEIIRFYEMSKEEYMQFCHNAIKAADNFSFDKLSDKLIEVINKDI